MQENNENKANMQLSNIYVVLLVFILGLVSLGIFFVNNSEKDKTITVSGKSSSMQKNEIASFSVTAEANNADKQTAVKAVSDKSQEIVTAIKQFGIEDKDIQTTNLNVYQTQDPILEKGVTVYRPGNWYATYMVNITLRDLTKSTELTNLLASFDKTSIFGPNLQVDNKNVDEATLLQDAIANAKLKASAMALKAGKRLGGVVSIIETTPNSNPILYAKGADSLSGLGGGGGFPIEAGTTEIQKYVVVTYWMK
jgi:uncharacterized protein YggE